MVKYLSADCRGGHSTLGDAIQLKHKAHPYYRFGKAGRAKRGHWTKNAVLGGGAVAMKKEN